MPVAKRTSDTHVDLSELRARIDPERFARSFVASLKSPLSRALTGGDKAHKVLSVQRLIRAQLLELLRPEALNFPRTGSAVAPGATRRLPVAELNPNEVIKRKLVEMSRSNLYRAADDGRFYSITPKGRTNGRLFPEWQFVESVPSVLPEILSLMKQHSGRERHALLVSTMDELNELSPAEVLAGMPFETRPVVEDAQLRLLNLPSAARLAEVKQAMTGPAGSEVVG